MIVGATFTGTEVADWLQAATIALVGEIPLSLLREAVPAFPTRSEVWLRLLERWSAQTLSAKPPAEPEGLLPVLPLNPTPLSTSCTNRANKPEPAPYAQPMAAPRAPRRRIRHSG